MNIGHKTILDTIQVFLKHFRQCLRGVIACHMVILEQFHNSCRKCNRCQFRGLYRLGVPIDSCLHFFHVPSTTLDSALFTRLTSHPIIQMT